MAETYADIMRYDPEKEEMILLEENEILRDEIRKEALSSDLTLTCTNTSCRGTYNDSEDYSSKYVVKELSSRHLISCIINHPSKLCIQSTSRMASRDDELRVVGEVAFQLDRRILQHIFAPRKRLYGFTATNIESKINECGVAAEDTNESVQIQKNLRKKYETLMDFLEDSTGYNRQYHPKFSELLVNTFGVVHKNSTIRSNLEYVEIKSAIVKCIGTKFVQDAMILLESLAILATFDGRNLLL